MSSIIIAANEAGVRTLIDAVRENMVFAWSIPRGKALVSASVNISVHLEGGRVDFRGDNTIRISELDIIWDRVELGLYLDIPQICVGGFCIIPSVLVPGCLLRAPEFCIFGSNPDVALRINLGGLVRSEVTLSAEPAIKYNNQENKWLVFLQPSEVDIDPIDVADTVGDLLYNTAKLWIENALSIYPIWAQDLILTYYGGIVELVRTLLDIPDDIQEWLSDLLGISFGALNFLAEAIGKHFASKNPIFTIYNPFPVLGKPGSVDLVAVPIDQLAAYVDDTEMVISASIADVACDELLEAAKKLPPEQPPAPPVQERPPAQVFEPMNGPGIELKVFDQISWDSGSISGTGTIVIRVGAPALYNGSILENGLKIQTFQVWVYDTSDNPLFGRVPKIIGLPPEPLVAEIDLETREAVINDIGYLLFKAPFGEKGYSFLLEPVPATGYQASDYPWRFDSRRLKRGHIFSVTMLRPGTYTVTETFSSKTTKIKVSYPEVGSTTYLPPEAIRVFCHDDGFNKSLIDIQPGQTILFEGDPIEDPATSYRIKIDLSEADDGPRPRSEGSSDRLRNGRWRNN